MSCSWRRPSSSSATSTTSCPRAPTRSWRQAPSSLWKILYATGVCDYVLLDHALFTLQGPGFLLFFLGLTGLFWKGEKNAASARFTNYDIDYQGNLNLIEAARAAGVRHFGYVSVINADKGEGIPMVHSKYLLEEALKASGLTYVIWRPTGYFYDIAHVFWPMVKSKSVQLLKTKGGFEPRANVVDARDFARFILETMCDGNKTYSVGGTETYTYRQIAEKSYAPVIEAELAAKAAKEA